MKRYGIINKPWDLTSPKLPCCAVYYLPDSESTVAVLEVSESRDYLERRVRELMRVKPYALEIVEVGAWSHALDWDDEVERVYRQRLHPGLL